MNCTNSSNIGLSNMSRSTVPLIETFIRKEKLLYLSIAQLKQVNTKVENVIEVILRYHEDISLSETNIYPTLVFNAIVKQMRRFCYRSRELRPIHIDH